MNIATKINKSELQIKLEKQTPFFLKNYKIMILEVIENYIYIPDFIGRNDYIYNSFIKKIGENNINSSEIMSEIEEIKIIIRDIADGKYFQKLELI